MTVVTDRVDREVRAAGFGRLVRAEFTKFRSVRSWAIGILAGAALLVILAALTGYGSRSTYTPTGGGPDVVGHPPVPIGPGGQPVVDDFYFVHRPVSGDGSITVRLDSLTAQSISPNTGSTEAAVPPWAKVGLMIKSDTDPGASYAAVMITGGNGARLQYDFTGDVAGPVDLPDPAWLRIERSGNTVTGLASADGRNWETIAAVELPLGQTVQAGLFATAPMEQTVTQHLGGGGSVTANGTVYVTANFDAIAVQGWSNGGWTGTALGSGPEAENAASHEGFRQSGDDGMSVTGSGDIAPDTGGSGAAPERILVGGFGTLTIATVLAALFVTSEYRRGMIRTTVAASPHRGRILLAKAIVVGSLWFVVSAVSVGIALPLGRYLLESNGNFVTPTSVVTDLRLVFGTATVLALSAVFALGVAAILRRGATAVVVVVALVVLPYLLATAAVFPPAPSEWLLRITPAAAFAVQQTLVAYPQVDGPYTPAFGFYPLGPVAGLLVLALFTAVAMGVAIALIRRRDA